VAAPPYRVQRLTTASLLTTTSSLREIATRHLPGSTDNTGVAKMVGIAPPSGR
jgi:hypothetical protein